MSGQGDWSPGLWELHPKDGIEGVNPHPGRRAKILGPRQLECMVGDSNWPPGKAE